MSTSIAFGLAAPNRKTSPRRIPLSQFFGSAAIAGLVLGCGWTVYTNIFAASVYPSMSSAGYDAPVVKRQASVAVRRDPPAFNEVFASLPPPAAVSSKSETAAAGPSVMFSDRFAAAQPQSVPSRAAEATPAAEPAKLAEVSRPVDAVKSAEPAKKIEAPKLAEAPKSKEAAPQTQVALNIPPPGKQIAEAKPTDVKSADTKPAAKSGSSLHDMAQRAKAAVMSIASHDRPSMVEKLWGKRETASSLLSYASADASVTGSIPSTLNQNPMLGGSPPYDRQTAVYDISARTVYLPDGTKLEAHSGLGSRLDDPRSSHLKMVGVTPPHIYELTPREALFHGVPALRLNPIGGEGKIFNRVGLLAHTFMLGPNGDSNGCVSFKDYYAFLDAYRNKGIRRLAVLSRIE